MKKRKKHYPKKDILFSRGLFVGTLFVLFLGIVLYKVGKTYTPSSSSSSQQSVWPELIESKTADPLVATVETFYTYIANQQFDLAYNLLSKTFKKDFGDYIEFSKGYATTVKTTLQEVKLDDEMQDAVRVRIVASDTIENKVVTRTFIGRWKLVKEEGTWKLDTADIQQIE